MTADSISDSDSDSSGSHISATPPRASYPSHPPNSRARVSPIPTLKRSKPQSQPTKPYEPKLSKFSAAELSNLHGFSVKKIQQNSDSIRSTSFSSLVRSRRPFFDPFSDLSKDDVAAPLGSVPTDRAGSRINIVRLHPNWLGPETLSPVAPPPQPLKRPKVCCEGNFVRLNINGYGRGKMFSYRKGKKRAFPPRRYRRFSKGSDKEESMAAEVNWSTKQWQSSGCDGALVEAGVDAARAEPSDENMGKLLKLTHGYDGFREGQLEAIRQVVAGESTMLVLPTGAGKSLCYQLPALILPGLTLVVSPLVSLMVDQLRQLPPAIPGGLLCSNQTSEEASETLEQIHAGHIKVLFISPERFLNSDFLSMCEDALSISLVAIDEAHCISEWSHNFRPSYLRLRASEFRSMLNVQCFLAMTATATIRTLHDIMGSLEIPYKNLIQACQVRENLQLFVSLSNNRLKDLSTLMKSSPVANMRSIIVYCKFQAEAELVSKHLCDNNIPAKVYHSGIPLNERIRTQELFVSNKIRVVVATVAFGMGVDKCDVDAVIHFSLPESLEEYIQETGRAGRDGRLSYCHLLLDNTTYYKLHSLLYSDGVDECAINNLLSHIFCKDISLNGNVYSLVKESASCRFDMKEQVLFTVLTLLEIGDVQYLCLQPQLNVTCTLCFHKTPPEVLSVKDVLVATIISESEKKQGQYVFDIPTIVNCARTTSKDLLDHIRYLKSLGEITYDLKDPAFCFTIVKMPDDFCTLATNLTKFLSKVEKCKVQKLDEMFKVANFTVKECSRIDGCTNTMHSPCIRKKVSEYFCRDSNVPSNFSSRNQSSPFLRADIKVFLQANSHVKFTPRAVARIMHGIPSPAFPYTTWSKCHFWGRYTEIEFPVVMKAATLELMDFVRKGGT